MAKIVKIKSELKKQRNMAGLISALAVLFAFIFAVVGAVMLYFLFKGEFSGYAACAVPAVLFIASFIMLIFSAVKRRKLKFLNAGVSGENAAADILKRLPKEYTVITNPVIHSRGKENELDFLVIGKNRVFIVEAKNYGGTVTGNSSEQKWRQIKYIRGGKTEEKTVNSPLKQAERQIKRLETLFYDNNIKAPVYGAVYFINDRAELKITYDSKSVVRIFTDGAELLQYIMKSGGKSVCSADRAKIIRILKM